MHAPLSAIAALTLFITPASAAAPVDQADAPSDGLVVVGGETRASWRTMTSVRVGQDGCYDTDGGLPDASEEGRRLKVWECDGSAAQSFLLENGVLYVGYDKTVQVVPDIKPDWSGCLERTLRSQIRFYRIATCSGTPHATGVEANLYDPANAILRSHTPTKEDVLTEGRPLLVAPITDKGPARIAWEFLPRRQLIRAIGTNLCITPPPGDVSPGAPLFLDSCDKPMVNEAGRAGDNDGRARITFRARSAQGSQYW
jgi:hypothetical protein